MVTTGSLLLFAGITFLVLCYLLPWWIAARKKSHDKSLILFLNFFFGWTIIGWVVCFWWPLTPKNRRAA